MSSRGRTFAESANPANRSLDVPGQLTGILFLTALTFSVVQSQHAGWTGPSVLTSACIAAGSLVAFIVVEHRVSHPVLPLNLIRRGQLPVAVIVAMCMTFGMYGLLLLASLDLQQQRGASALAAGAQLLPLPLVFALASPVAGRLVTRFGPKLPMGAGMTLMSIGMFGYAALSSADRLIWIEVTFVLIGLGLALNTGPVVGVAVAAVEPARAGLASGIANLARMLGAALGVAVLGTVLATASTVTSDRQAFTTGLRAALLVGAVVELTGAIIAFTLIRTKKP